MLPGQYKECLPSFSLLLFVFSFGSDCSTNYDANRKSLFNSFIDQPYESEKSNQDELVALEICTKFAGNGYVLALKSRFMISEPLDYSLIEAPVMTLSHSKRL